MLVGGKEAEMTYLAEKRAELATSRRERVVDWFMAGLAAFLALIGVYTYMVPDTWFLGGLTEGWWLGSWMVAGLLMAVALWDYARMAYRRDGSFTGAEVSGFVFAGMSLLAGIGFMLVWIL